MNVFVSCIPRIFNLCSFIHAQIGQLSCMASMLHITETNMKTHIPEQHTDAQCIHT